jgi:NADP-dependent 3-hydroxy acid dehydrogenase YdfG
LAKLCWLYNLNNDHISKDIILIQNNQRLAIVTGASSGIGKATVERLLNDGHLVIVNSRRRDPLIKLEKKYNKQHKTIFTVCGDISEEDTIKEILYVSDTISDIPPSIFVLCAGHGIPGTVISSDYSSWEKLFKVNCLAALQQLRYIANKMKSHAFENNSTFVNDIVVIGSTIGRTVSSYNPVYGATKFALHSLVESLRQEVCNQNIRVTLIEPGFVQTEFQEAAGYDMQWFNETVNNIGPILQPEDIANAICFVINQPKHVHIDDIRIRPTRQTV